MMWFEHDMLFAVTSRFQGLDSFLEFLGLSRVLDVYRRWITVTRERINLIRMGIWPRGYKTIFIRNLGEHEICPANKFQLLTIANSFLLT